MKVTCFVIKDLLPLYSENMASSDSAKLVEEHIAVCEDCRNALEEMRALPDIPRQTDTSSLKRVKKGLRRRRFHMALFSFFFAATLLFGLLLYVTTPEYLSAEEAVESVTVTEDGYIYIKYKDCVQGSDWDSVTQPEEAGGVDVTLRAWKYRFWDPRQSKPLSENYVLRFPVDRVWYSAVGGGEDTLLWGEPVSGGRITLPRLYMSFYFLISLAGAAVFTLLSILLRRKKFSWFTAGAALFCGCFCICSLLVTGGSFVSYHANRLLFGSLILSALLCGTWMNGYAVWKLHRQDSGL